MINQIDSFYAEKILQREHSIVYHREIKKSEKENGLSTLISFFFKLFKKPESKPDNMGREMENGKYQKAA